jgi:two-component system response regulator
MRRPGHNPVVLLVEDNRDDEILAVRAFTSAGLPQPIIARDGVEALRLVQERSDLALVLLDIKLPKLSGLDVLKAIRMNRATRDLPVVMLSSSDMPTDIDASYHLGASSYVTKPMELHEYMSTLRGVLRYWTGVNRARSD